MATQKRASRPASRTVSKKSTKMASGRKRLGLKAGPAASRSKRATASAVKPAARKAGVIKRAIKRGISELAKVGS